MWMTFNPRTGRGRNCSAMLQLPSCLDALYLAITSVTNILGQLSLASFRGRLIEYQPRLW